MTRVLSTALVGALCVLFVVVGISQPVPHPETYLAVEDKPYVEMAQAAHEEAEAEMETYQDEPSYEVETYYEPTYYNSYWYESDDEEAEAAAKEWIAWRESGGDYNSRNGQYVGKFQLSEDKLNGDWSPENQEATADAYVAERYGSWQAAKEFWEANNWY